MTDDLDTMVRRYLEGEVPPAREAAVLHRIADDVEARALLRQELQVRAAWSGAPPAVPEGFADRTMAAIAAAEENEAAVPAPALTQWLKRVWKGLVAPRPISVRPGLVGAALVLILGVTAALWPAGSSEPPGASTVASTASTASSPGTGVARPATQREVVWTRFMYTSDEASSVAVAGDFSGWDPIPLSAKTVDGRTVWTGMVPVSKGEHQYMFVIDGSRWVTDPLAPVQRSDGFGNKNAVLQL